MPARSAPVSLGELWQLALPEGTRVAAGAAGLERGVTWVASLGATFPLFGTIEPGYLAFVDLEVAQRIDARITFPYLARELLRAGVAGLVLSQAPGADDTALAESLELPLLILPPGADLATCERNVLRSLIDHEGQLARRELEAREILQAAWGRGDVDGLAQRLAVLARSQVRIRDARGSHVAAADPPAPSQDEAVPPSRDLTVPIRLAGRTLGELSLSAPRAGRTLAGIYARQAAELYAAELLQRHVRRETEERLGAELMEELLDPASAAGPLLSRLAHQGYAPSEERHQVAVALTGTLPLNRRQNAPSADVLEVARSLERAASRDGAATLQGRYRGAVVCLLALEGDTLAERVRYWLSVALPTQTDAGRCHVGVSRIAEGDLAGLRVAVQQALDALEVGHRAGSPSSPYHYGELGLYRLLATMQGQAEVSRFVEETLGPLLRYDSEHHTELVPSLAVYLQEHGNASRAAQELFIHRNTLAYRLDRIRELLGVDVNDPEARLALHLALKLHALRPS